MIDTLLIRHTKKQVLGGEAVLQLPPKTVELVPGGLQLVIDGLSCEVKIWTENALLVRHTEKQVLGGQT